MQLFLIRHAESENNAKPSYQRVEDPPITARGRLQANHLAEWARTLRIDTLITSPFLRTLQSVQPLLKAVPHRLHIWHDVFERGGCFRGHIPGKEIGAKGLGRGDLLRQIAELEIECIIDDTIQDHGWWAERPMETQAEAEHRAALVMQRLADTFGPSGEVIVVITHADFKRLLLGELLRGVVDPSKFGAMRNTGISKMNYDGERWTLDWFNSVSHLPARLITGSEH